jgi:hypothetical protein
MVTKTDYRLKSAGRKYYGVENSEGQSFDTLSLTLEPVNIINYYTDTNTAEVQLRDDKTIPAFECQILVPFDQLIDDDVAPQGLDLDNCTILTDPQSKRHYIKLKEQVVGVILAIKGDYGGNGAVLLGLTYMEGEGPLQPKLPTDIDLKMGNNEIKISNSGIEITSDNLIINGEPFVNGG